MTQLLMRRPDLLDIPDAAPLQEGYVLRLADGAEDVRPLASTLSAAFGEPWDEVRVRSSLTETPDIRAVYVVARDGRPVATASSRLVPERFPGSGYVHWVGTHPEHAGKGLASALVARVLWDFAERGCEDAVLETDDFRLPAVRTYLKFGFLPVYGVSGEDHGQRWSQVLQRVFGR